MINNNQKLKCGKDKKKFLFMQEIFRVKNSFMKLEKSRRAILNAAQCMLLPILKHKNWSLGSKNKKNA
ncbi:MAG: hypothetical protein GXO74_14525 [Calditrichaeota bacterium]|nr:hypothetical protein [Calditrichota bacterium]